MSTDSQMGIAIGVAILLVIVVPAALLVWFTWRAVKRGKLPKWIVVAAVPCALVIGYWLTFNVVFDDLGATRRAQSAAPTFIVSVPPAFAGSVYLFFDPSLPALKPTAKNEIAITLPPSGKVVVGGYPGMNETLNYATFRVVNAKGDSVPRVTLASEGGQWTSVHFRHFFVGSMAMMEEDHARRERDSTLYDEDKVFQSLTGHSPMAGDSAR
jgi:hypothetical protein